MTSSVLEIKKYNQEGDIAHEYNPLRNMLYVEDKTVGDFRTKQINCDLNNPASIECQPSYDGTVNLIINDDKNPPRIINNRFTVLEDNRYKIINRNQLEQTNLYKNTEVDKQTRLFRNLNTIPKIDLNNVTYYGQLAGGNYTFYVKFADNDYNQTDIVCESGQISIFKGTFSSPRSVSGTLFDELTDKAIILNLSNIDTSFSKVYLYYTRETSDVDGGKLIKAYSLTTPYEIKHNSMIITVNGFENVNEISIEELNIKYNLVTSVKTQAQVQNMLFFGNVQGINLNLKDLQNISLYIKVQIEQDTESIGYLNENYEPLKTDDVNQTEYYNPNIIYYKLGYWPSEIYRLGIVYIMNDDSLSPVFNLRGHKFSSLRDVNYTDNSSYPSLFNDENDIRYIPQDEFIIEDGYLDNTKGVFKNPENINLYTNNSGVEENGTYPLYYKITLNDDILNELTKYQVKGYFIVRQRRIPTILAQGLSIGVDRTSYIPMLKYNDDYISEAFIDEHRILTSGYSSRKISVRHKQCSGILSLDAYVDPLLRSMFDGSQYTYQKYRRGILENAIINNRHYFLNKCSLVQGDGLNKLETIFIDEDIPLKYVNNNGFSTRAGSAEEVKQFAFFGSRDYGRENWKLLRGTFCPFLGLTSNIEDNCIYNIKIQNYSSVFEKEYFSIRANDNSAFYAISNRFAIPPLDPITNIRPEQLHNVFRGDCYTNTVTIRLHKNFIDSDVPVNEIIVSPNSWKDHYGGYNDTSAEGWLQINKADLNSVPIGTWVTFKCLSNYNLGLRSQDRSYPEEQAIMGSPRTFYPLTSLSTSPTYKIPESFVLNGGYNNTLSRKRNLISPNVPYIKDLYDNRIMFSNVQVDDDFRNSYRIFQGLSYEDIDRQYGAIVKLIPWGVNLLCVFEHGVAIIPINEKALIATQSGQPIHMYGAGVLQNQVTLISSDYGSIWQESIVRTPLGVYGVDTYAKKIWRFSEQKGFELLSDVKIQRFLNDNIELLEQDKYPTIALRNVKTHFNNYKGDVMFTFYNNLEDTEWNMCYNERLDKWITRYTWTPLYSENINNIFYTLDKKRAEILAHIYDNRNSSVGINTSENEWKMQFINDNPVLEKEWRDFNTQIRLRGYDFYNDFDLVVKEVTSSYLDINNKEIFVKDLNPFDFMNLHPGDDTHKRGLLLDEKEYDGIKYDINGNVIQEVSSEKIIKFQNFKIKKDILNYKGNDLFYFKIKVEVTPKITEGSAKGVQGSTFTRYIGIVLSRDGMSSENLTKYNELLINGFYVHGKAGIFDEINTKNESREDQILPTKWYNKQEPFEFEFVVNNVIGMHKIFNDLVIISNNVQPNELEFEIIGDVYDFNKSGIYKQEHFPENDRNKEFELTDMSQIFKENVTIKHDHILNEYSIVATQKCFDLKSAGRLRGNIQYKEDAWYTVIEPIKYKKAVKESNTSKRPIDKQWTEVRVRDKFLKIRVKYTGEDIVVITALKTLMTISYS